MSKPDIIIVEDDPLVGEISRDILAGAGYAVQLVPESREAVAAVRAGMPKLVITDIMMPGVTGLDICKALKADPHLKDIPVMVMSAKSFETEKRRAAMFGAAYFLVKPFSEKSLLSTVAGILGPREGK
ncbi:MAG: response regulator [Elusimicrobia bacterium]|nr:response regulator [Elusimicrobiota bacterium]